MHRTPQLDWWAVPTLLFNTFARRDSVPLGGCAALVGAVYEGFEDFVLDLFIEREFGVPLYADYPSFIVGRVRFDGLNYAAGAGRGYPDPWGGLGDAIAVQADNFFQSGDTENVHKFTVRRKVNRVAL